jgi:hypothetical protein
MNIQNFFKDKRLKIILASIGTLFSVLFAWYLTWLPVFVIHHQVIKFTDPIVIKAGNSVAKKRKHLNVKFDERLFEKQAILQKNNDLYVWHFWIKDQNYSPDMINAGKHKIKVGFPGDQLSEEFVIEFKSHGPRFIISNPTLRSDATMIIKADNDEANIKKVLHVEFDSVLFPECGIPVDNDDRQKWHCNLRKLKLTDEMKTNGRHTIRFRFPDGDLSKAHTIILLTQKIVVNTELSRKDNVNIFRGKTAGQSQIEDNDFQVDVIFYHEGPDNEISIPIQRKKDEATGVIYYEFETKFSDFPKISPEDEKYSQTFFEFRITDKAGNMYRQNQSYAQFIAPGSMLSGSNDWADINIKKKLPKDQANRTLTNIFSLYPNTDDDVISIHLTVSCQLKNVRHLKWKSNKPKAMTFVYRDGNKIANSNTDEYIDKNVKAGETVSYSVVQTNESGETFTSNTFRSAAPSEQFAILTLRSNVRNDTVFVDDQKKGSTRLDEKLPIGKHVIRVEKKGYKPFERTIDLTKDQVLWANLKLLPGSLRVTTKPEGAAIYLNGKKSGISPATLEDLASGRVDISVELIDYQKQKKTIQIQPEKQRSIHFDLEKIITYLNISVVTHPSGAAVFVNGKKKGVSPLTINNITPGNYELKTMLTGYLDQVRQIQLKDKNEQIRFDLIKKAVIGQKYRLRSRPKELSDDEALKLVDKIYWGRPRRYIENDYVDNGDGTVTDRATGLMWQQGGSGDRFDFEEAKNYINQLNKEKFGGYNDWRLPTLEELISLIEKDKRDKGLYIDSVFSNKQPWCWTADTRSSGGAFGVNFINGIVNDWGINCFVRAVRSFPDNDG